MYSIWQSTMKKLNAPVDNPNHEDKRRKNNKKLYFVRVSSRAAHCRSKKETKLISINGKKGSPCEYNLYPHPLRRLSPFLDPQSKILLILSWETYRKESITGKKEKVRDSILQYVYRHSGNAYQFFRNAMMSNDEKTVTTSEMHTGLFIQAVQ